MGAGSINGNDITSVLVFESNGTDVKLSFLDTVIPESGPYTLTHTAPFQPVLSLIVGIDLPIAEDPNSKRHLVMFTSQAFINSIGGRIFGQVFTGYGEQNFMNRMLLARAGDATEADFVVNFFNTAGKQAAFSSTTAPSTVEFSAPVIHFEVPEPGTYLYSSGALAGLFLLRRRQNNQ